MKRYKINKKIILLIFTSTVLSFFVLYILYADKTVIVHKEYTSTILYTYKGPHEETAYMRRRTDKNNIPYVYTYREGNTSALQNWLAAENSNLAKEPYFSQIITSSKNYNLNPCLLFAITGKEQSFVPSDHPLAHKISNNPFNVYGSWQIYNTSIKDSADTACKTIIKISKDRPPGEDFLKWLNTKDGTGGYAEDILWHKGVSKFFKKLNNEIY